MSEKVFLTQEQADAIEDLLKDRTAESIVKEKANPLLGGGVYIDKSNHIIFTETELDTLIRALYIGYEVEPVFNVGDWVVHEFGSKTYKIAEGKPLIECDYVLDNGNSVLKDYLRHATPSEIAEEKQRRWWKSHNRDVWELKINDMIYSKVTKTYDEVVFVFRSGSVNLRGTTPNDFSQYGVNTVPKEELNNHNFKVICFAEDRKDV